jgi:hypothetical protein
LTAKDNRHSTRSIVGRYAIDKPYASRRKLHTCQNLPFSGDCTKRISPEGQYIVPYGLARALSLPRVDCRTLIAGSEERAVVLPVIWGNNALDEIEAIKADGSPRRPSYQ